MTFFLMYLAFLVVICTISSSPINWENKDGLIMSSYVIQSNIQGNMEKKQSYHHRKGKKENRTQSKNCRCIVKRNTTVKSLNLTRNYGIIYNPHREESSFFYFLDGKRKFVISSNGHLEGHNTKCCKGDHIEKNICMKKKKYSIIYNPH